MQQLIHVQFVTPITCSLSRSTLENHVQFVTQAYMKIPNTLPIVRRALLWKTVRFPHSRGPNHYAGAIIDQGAPRKRRFLAVQN